MKCLIITLNSIDKIRDCQHQSKFCKHLTFCYERILLCDLNNYNQKDRSGFIKLAIPLKKTEILCFEVSL
jgi:hypothetical protein